MPDSIETGMRGQRAAEEMLLQKGYTVLERNYRAKTGEIDLIVRDGQYIAFVEVKYRSNTAYGLPREAVNYNKQQHIKNTALSYIASRHLSEQDFRFDVIEITGGVDKMEIIHIENAFQ